MQKKMQSLKNAHLSRTENMEFQTSWQPTYIRGGSYDIENSKNSTKCPTKETGKKWQCAANDAEAGAWACRRMTVMSEL